MSKFYLIDGNAVCYRSFYAIKDLARSDGTPTNALYGFAVKLLKIIHEDKPDFLAVSFDRPEKTFRHEVFEAYKAHRKPMPDDLVHQMEPIKNMIKNFGIPVFEKAGFEADDVLATLAKKGTAKGMDVFILTGDKDMFQLINDHVRIVSLHQKDKIIDEKVLKSEYHLTPDQVVDFLALTGDAADGVPGVPGIGKITAQKLLDEFDTVDQVVKNVNSIKKEKLKTSIKESLPLLKQAKQLIKLDDKVKLDFKWELCRTPALSENEDLKNLFKEYEFYSLYKNLENLKPSNSSQAKPTLLVESKKETLAFLRNILQSKTTLCFFYDESSRLLCCAEDRGKKAYAFPIDPDNKTDEACEVFVQILEAQDIFKIGYDLKSIVKMFFRSKTTINRECADLKILDYLINPEVSNATLAQLLSRRGMGFVGEEDLAQQACGLAEAYKHIEKDIERMKLMRTWNDIEKPLIKILAKMELEGIKIDPAYFQGLKKEFQKELNTLKKSIYKESGREFNIQSPKQLSEILFNKLKLPVIKKTKTGYSTNVDVLEKLAGMHKLPKLMLEFRHLSKLVSTYVIPLMESCDPKTHHVHTTFLQTGTATGRLSSRDPNLQNIPVRTVYGEKIRYGFIPHSSKDILISADYSQIELRILAHLSGDPKLCQAFYEGEDIHAHTAMLLFQCPLRDVTRDQRRVAKTVNFGIIYGMGTYGLARDLDISFNEAKNFIDRYFENYQGIKNYTCKVLEGAKKNGYVETLYGRRRPVLLTKTYEQGQKSGVERMAINAPLQGTAADIIKMAMIRIDRRIEQECLDFRMLLQIHDELIFNCPKNLAEKAKKVIKTEMEGCVHLDVPLVVHVSEGEHWSDL